jgi:hypothetical protein
LDREDARVVAPVRSDRTWSEEAPPPRQRKSAESKVKRRTDAEEQADDGPKVRWSPLKGKRDDVTCRTMEKPYMDWDLGVVLDRMTWVNIFNRHCAVYFNYSAQSVSDLIPMTVENYKEQWRWIRNCQ